MFFKIDNTDIPLVTTGTNPFIGAGQFGYRGIMWRRRFLENTDEMVKILDAGYQAGARGIEAVPVGKILEAAKVMTERYDDYVVTGSTYPARDPGINSLMEAGAKVIFVHGMIADLKGRKLLKLLDEVNSLGVIPGIATHF